MSKPHTYLNKAVDALSSAMSEKRDWPVDLAESAPKWAELMKQLAEVANWMVQGAVVVRDDAEQLSPRDRQALEAKTAHLLSALTVSTASRPRVDNTWRAVAATFTRARVPGTGEVRPTLVVGAVHEAAQAVRKAADQRLMSGDVVPTLSAASVVCDAMCGLAIRLAVAVEQREDAHPALAGIGRGLRRSIHNPYREAGEHFAHAAVLAEQIMARWPNRWPNSV